MAQARMMMKALRVRRILRRLARAKENSIRAMVGLPPVMSWYDQCCMGVSAAVRECLCRAFCPCCVDRPTFGELCCPKYSFGYNLCTDGRYPNALLKSFLGFLFGCLLSVGIFLFLCLQLEANMEYALAICIVLGLVLSLGMAFSTAVRCLVFLALPNFCSSKGRSFLIMYAMVLILNHPVQNFSHNLTVLTDAATCGQSMALNETKKLVEAAASPLLSVIGGIREMLSCIRRFAEDLRQTFIALARAVEEVVATLSRVFQWLASMVDVCNHNMGQPYRKCKKVFEDGYHECRDALSIFNFLCDVVSLVGKVCHIARIGELLCVIASVVKDLVLSKIGPPITQRIGDLKEMFYFNVTINYHYHYNMNQSKPYSEIRDAILQEIQDKLSVVDVLQSVVDNVMSLTVLLVVVKAFLYRRGYLHRDNYDNNYITRNLYQIDAKRVEMDKESIFPLKTREKFKYIKTFSLTMTQQEAKKMIKGLLFWAFAAFHATYYMLCDFGLYWILDLIRHHMDVHTRMAIPPHLKLHIDGQGPMPDMYKAMVGVLEPVSDSDLDIDTTVCLPNPSPPAYAVYWTVVTILILCFFLTVFEAYGMRLRHVVAACYYPYREQVRAVWLYNHILQTRGSFLTFMRRQLHRRKKNDRDVQKISLRSRLAGQFPLLKPVLKCLGFDRKHCLSCGEEGRADDHDNFTHCDNCKTPYCNDCFADLGNICTACMNPVDYGDADDESVETDSSEEEQDKAIRVANIKARKQKAIQKRNERRPSEVMRVFRNQIGLPGTSSKLALLESQQSSSSEDDSEAEEEENEVEEESSSQYDTDYQHHSVMENTSDEDSPLPPTRLRRMQPRRSHPDMVTTDVFRDE